MIHKNTIKQCRMLVKKSRKQKAGHGQSRAVADNSRTVADNPRTVAGARGHKVSAMIRKRPRADDRGKGADYFGSAWTSRGKARTNLENVADFRRFDWKVAECPRKCAESSG